MKRYLWGLAIVALLATSAHAQKFSCAKKYCKAMRSCSEAVFHLRQCGDSKRDGDNDGIPCENICGKTKARMNALLKSGQ